MRLKTLSCREKLSFMAGVLWSKGSEAECAHKLIVPVPRCPDPGTRAGWGRGGGRLLRYWHKRPSFHPERRSAANPGLAARGRRQSWKESRTERSRFLGPSGGSRHRGLQVPPSSPARLPPATGSKWMRGPAHEPAQVPPLAGVRGGATRLPWRLALFVFRARRGAAMATQQPCQPKSKPPACSERLMPVPPLRLKVVGLFKSSSFQVSKTIAEVTPRPRHHAPRPLAALSPAFRPRAGGGRGGQRLAEWKGDLERDARARALTGTVWGK